MFASIFVTVALARATPSPAPVAAPSNSPTAISSAAPEWVSVPPDPKKNVYADLVLQEPDGSTSEITAMRQICQCTVEESVSIDLAIFGTIRGATVQQQPTTMCEEAAQALTLVGPRNAQGLQVVTEIIEFRHHDSLISMHYTHRLGDDSADAIAQMTSICPP